MLSIDKKLAHLTRRHEELLSISDQQSRVIKDPAEQNQELIPAIRNTRLAALASPCFEISLIKYPFMRL